MAIPEKIRKKVYEDCTINGLSQRDAKEKYKISRFSVQAILKEYAEDERLLREIKNNQLALKTVQESTKLHAEAELDQKDILQVFKDGLKAKPIPTVELKTTRTKHIYKHEGDEKTLVMSEVIEDVKEIQSDKLIEHQMKCADRLLTLLTGSDKPQDTNFVIELE